MGSTHPFVLCTPVKAASGNCPESTTACWPISISICAAVYHTVLHHADLCHAVLHDPVLHHAVLCQAVLGCVINKVRR
jgi:hypothetical protein